MVSVSLRLPASCYVYVFNGLCLSECCASVPLSIVCVCPSSCSQAAALVTPPWNLPIEKQGHTCVEPLTHAPHPLRRARRALPLPTSALHVAANSRGPRRSLPCMCVALTAAWGAAAAAAAAATGMAGANRCVDASASHAPFTENNTRWALYALPDGKSPALLPDSAGFRAACGFEI